MILQARLQQYVNRKLPDVQAGFRKGRGGRRLPAGDPRNLRVSSAKMELLTFIWGLLIAVSSLAAEHGV